MKMNVAIKRVRKHKLEEPVQTRKRKRSVSKSQNAVQHLPVTRSRHKSSSPSDSVDDNIESELSTNNQKRFKLEENSLTVNSVQKVSKIGNNNCEKENIVKTSWIQVTKLKETTNDKDILRDNKSSVNNKIIDQSHEVDSTERLEFSSNKFSKPSGPLSPIDSQNINKHTTKISPRREKEEYSNDHTSQLMLGNEVSEKLNIISDHSLNDVWSSLQGGGKFYHPKIEEVKEEGYSNVLSSCGSFTQPRSMSKFKKQRKRVDPAVERERQNFECYKEYWKLKTMYTLIERELKQVKVDSEKYEDTLQVMNDNKERHEDELGYYLGIEDNRKKRVRRLATEIERKHKCLVPKCPKAYGSEGSLNQHLIRKHPMVYEEWMRRITEKEQEDPHRKNQLTREEKDEIRVEIEKISMTLCRDDESGFDDSD